MRAFFVLLAASAAACSPSGGKPAPARVADGGRVRDSASIMSMASEQRVESQLAKLEAATSDQVGVVTVPSLNGQPVEQYSLSYARRWALGRKDLDNGVLILVAPREHKVRIEVGTGLEGLLTDVRAAAIVGDMISPFRQARYDAGIELGVGEIGTLLMADRRRPQPKPHATRKAA